MCFMCGWPSGWAHPVQVAEPPVKEEYIYLDGNTAWYPDQRKGIHPPAPVYQGGMAGMGMPGMGMYGMASGYGYSPYDFGQGYGAGNFSSAFYGGWPQGFHPTGSRFSSCYPVYPSYPCSANNYYPTFAFNSSSRPNTYYWSAPGQPMTFPMPNCPQGMSTQAAAAAAANAQLFSMPGAPPYFVGGTPAEIAAQQAMMNSGMGFNNMMQPGQVAPYKPAGGQQFWCKETDGSWTLRTHSDIINGDVSPGHWERHPGSGYFYWVRQVG